MHLSFVLLPRPYDAQGAPIVDAHARLFPSEPRPLTTISDGSVAELRHRDGLTTIVALMPAPIPNGEAEDAARLSMSAFSPKYGPLPSHAAHLVVTTSTAPGPISPDTLLRHTRVVAAAASAYGAVGVYEGNACATHPAAFYLDAVSTSPLPLMVWTGVSVAREPDGRTSMLTLGVQNMLGVPDVLVSASPGGATEALAFACDMIRYVLDRGAALEDGHTVGRTAEEKILVRYVPSPLDASRQVVRLDIP